MTTVTFQTEGSRIVGFEVKGHSGYAPEGEDIVCAAITSAVSTCQTLLAALMVHCVQLAEEYPENISVMEV